MKDYKKLEQLGYEAFLRRSAEVNAPFMLKGSYITRQYFPKDIVRHPSDLDWVYMNYIQDPATAGKIFSEWATAVTEYPMYDGVRFESFRENDFWRMIDYAMDDDFPTVNTDLVCYIGDEEIDLHIDISFNLDIDRKPIPLYYTPLEGDSFTIPFTVPLSTQVAWKIHQSMVRPRMKDIFDITYLVRHPDFDKAALDHCLQTLVNECAADNADINCLEFFLKADLNALFNNNFSIVWQYWRFNEFVEPINWSALYGNGHGADMTDINQISVKKEDFVNQFKAALQIAGFSTDTLLQLPQATYQKRKKPEKVKVMDNTSSITLEKTPPTLIKSIMKKLSELFK